MRLQPKKYMAICTKFDITGMANHIGSAKHKRIFLITISSMLNMSQRSGDIDAHDVL